MDAVLGRSRRERGWPDAVIVAMSPIKPSLPGKASFG
jgi:hypothetical protein